MSENRPSSSVATHHSSGQNLEELQARQQQPPATILTRTFSSNVGLSYASNALSFSQANRVGNQALHGSHHRTQPTNITRPHPTGSIGPLNSTQLGLGLYNFPQVSQGRIIRTQSPSEIVLHQEPSHHGSPPAKAEIHHKEGLAAKRRERHVPEVTPIPFAARAFETLNFISEDPSQATARTPGTRNKRSDGPSDAWRKLQIKESGGTCSNCYRKKKVCDPAKTCRGCEDDGKFCFRGIEQLWLCKSTQQVSLQRGSREEALSRAQSETFIQSGTVIPTLPSMDDLSQHSDNCLMFYLTSAPNNPKATSYFAMQIGQLATIMQSPPRTMLDQLDTFLAVHIPVPTLVGLTSEVERDSSSLLASALNCFRIFHFITTYQHTISHVGMRDLSSARFINLALFRFCAKALLVKTNEVLEELRRHIRIGTETTRPAIGYAIGLYWRIVAGLEWSCATSASDVVLCDMISSTGSLLDSIEALAKDQLPSGEDFLTFVHRCIPSVSMSYDLHLSHAILGWDGSPVTNRDATSFDPFTKDFTIVMRRLLTYNGKFWTDLRSARASEAGLWPMAVPDPKRASSWEHVSATAHATALSGSSSHQTGFGDSHDHTIVASHSNASTTLLGSPSNERTPPRDDEQPQLLLEDDGPIRHLMHIDWSLEQELKRPLSPALPGSSRGSPPRKRIELNYPQTVLLAPPTPESALQGW